MIPYLFIVNGKKPLKFQEKVKRSIHLHYSKDEYHVETTLSLQAGIDYIHENATRYETVVAIGGDGTIFGLIQALAETEINLGIIPTGSGNGLARNLGIPLNIDKALLHLKKSTPRRISLGKINNLWFANVAGIGGFDAVVCREFEHQKVRKIWGYIKVVTQQFFKFKAKNLNVKIDDGKDVSIKPFLFTIANGSQFGYNFYIAPKQDLAGTNFHIMALKKIPWYSIFYYLVYFTQKKNHQTSILSRLKGQEVKVPVQKGDLYQLDGEFFEIDSEQDLSISRIQNALSIKG